MNRSINGISFFLLASLLLFINPLINGQAHYIENYPGIPIIAHTNKSAGAILNPQLDKMKELGVMGFYATDMNENDYNRIKAKGLKVFPYEIWTANNQVVFYTDAIYTKWEAEGKGDGSNGDMELKYSNLGTQFTEGDIKGIVTNTNAPGKLTYGPGYYQYVNYKQLPIDTTHPEIIYRANFRLKIQQLQNLPTGYLDSIVCTLEVIASDPGKATEFEVDSRVVTVRDFIQAGDGWNQWDTLWIDNYDLDSLIIKNLNKYELLGVTSATPTDTFDTRYMQYRVQWAGRNFLKLYIDYIEISDQKGRELMTDPNIATDIKALVSTFKDTTHVLGWFGLNEPFTIDNYEPFRIVDNLVKSENINIRLYTTFNAGWTGTYGGRYPEFIEGNGYVYKGIEFIKRTKLSYLSLNTYMYNFPWHPSETPDGSYYLRNIDEVTYLNLRKLDSAGIAFSHSTQSGRFYQFEWDSVSQSCVDNFPGSVLPTSAQMLYHINLGLLYGMKELTCDPFFTLLNETGACTGSPYRDGLVNFYTGQLTTLGQTWKDKVAPRMSGLIGQTSRLLQPLLQNLNINLVTNPIINQSFIYQIEPIGSGTCAIDLGFFTNDADSNKKYFMAVNRYYSSLENLRFTFQNLTTYKNWEVTDLVDTIKTTVLADANNKAIFEDIITLGDGHLYSVLPVIIYGGALKYNETINGTVTLLEEMTIEAGATLTVNGFYEINKNITVKPGGKIVVNAGQRLKFLNGSRLIIKGEIAANGTLTNKIIFDFIQNSHTLNGIWIDSAATTNITHSIIKNASTGIYVYKAEPFIENCEIYYCNDGLYLYKSDYQLTMYTGTMIWHNNIHDNDNSGINLLDSEPQISGNDIYNNPVGIRCITGSHAVFGELGDPGANEIYDNGTSVYSNYSSPLLGHDDPEMFFGGYNTIAGDTYHLHAENGGYIYAELNYWGSDSTKIVAGTGSVIDYRPYLSFESNMLASGGGETTSGLSKGSSTNNTELNLTNEKLSEAMKLFLKKEYKQAWNICKNILSENSVSSDESSALTFINALYLIEKFRSKLDKNELKTLLSSYINSHEKKNIYGYAEILLAEMDKENYLQKMDNIIASYSGSIVELAMFKKFVYFYFEEKNTENAKAVYEDMIKQYPQSELTKEAAAILGESHNEIEKKETSPTTQVSKEFAASNYPNPFNPTTIISYSLPEKNHVTIKVFDILGREIAVLINEVKDEGTHSVNFDGSNLPSGFYIYTLSTNKNSISKKMLLLK